MLGDALSTPYAPPSTPSYPMTHGLSAHRVYRVWRAMITRCDNPRSKSYPDYGARGIRVCERWYSLVAFVTDMGLPVPGATIDRIDNHGPYAPGNCRWVTRPVQQRNTRRNLLIEIDGVTRCAAEWAEIAGLDQDVVTRRYNKGMRGSGLLTLRHLHRKLCANDAIEIREAHAAGFSGRAIARKYGVSNCAIYAVLNRKTFRYV